MEQKTYRLGTRKSLLAIAQSSWVAREVERLNPGIRVELVGIETKGDVILDKPLSQIEGKEFFTAELDHALLKREVDFTVHSMKDLALERPSPLVLAAVPKRELQHDVILFHESVMERLKQNLPIRIGTSSPRRLTLIPGFLKLALPRFSPGTEPKIQFVEIRGNVNTRLSRVHEQEGSERKLDGVVLAFAGLERLTLVDAGSKELRRLLENTRKMVLPLKPCPSAPAQGALAIESRSDTPRVLQILKPLHHEATLQGVKAERAILQEWGGGCHQKLGASALASGVLFIQGQKPSGEWVNETRGAPLPEATDFVKIEASDVFDFKKEPLSPEELSAIQAASFVFIAHSRAHEFLSDPSLVHSSSKKRIWVSGTKSWFKLSANGTWVEGSLDGQGFQALDPFRGKNLLQIPEKDLVFLSHRESPETNGTSLVGTYSHEYRGAPEKFLKSESIYWSSSLPFLALWSKLGPEIFAKKKHACGPGRTAQVVQEKLASLGLSPTVLSME
jgi:hydroxymethylbilane synthase